MGIFTRAAIGAATVAVLLPGCVGASHAAGALAIGACAAYGYAYDYPTTQAAQTAAIEKCAGTCKQVVTTTKGCVALAVDGHKPCGPHGFANASRLGAAQTPTRTIAFRQLTHGTARAPEASGCSG